MTGIWSQPWVDPSGPVRRWTVDMEIVARRVDRPWADVERALAPVAPGSLALDDRAVAVFQQPFGESAGALAARALLVTSGRRLVRYRRVLVEVDPWGDVAAELRVIPVSRGVGRWSARRQRRYFELAHAVADRLLAVVNAVPAAGPVRAAAVPPCGEPVAV
jgi:hypothetical protein